MCLFLDSQTRYSVYEIHPMKFIEFPEGILLSSVITRQDNDPKINNKLLTLQNSVKVFFHIPPFFERRLFKHGIIICCLSIYIPPNLRMLYRLA